MMLASPILVVSREPAMARSLSRALTQMGAVVRVASSAAEAARELEAASIAAVIADECLSDGGPDGIDVLAQALALAPSARRVLMGGIRTQRVRVALEAGIAQQFLAKPFGLSVVASLYRRILAQ